MTERELKRILFMAAGEIDVITQITIDDFTIGEALRISVTLFDELHFRFGMEFSEYCLGPTTILTILSFEVEQHYRSYRISEAQEQFDPRLSIGNKDDPTTWDLCVWKPEDVK